MMKLTKARSAILPAAVVIAAVALAGAASASPKIGEPAPAFTGLDSGGQKVSLQDYKGKTVVLEWTNHDCPYVRRHYGTGNMQKLQKGGCGVGHRLAVDHIVRPGHPGARFRKTGR